MINIKSIINIHSQFIKTINLFCSKILINCEPDEYYYTNQTEKREKKYIILNDIPF